MASIESQANAAITGLWADASYGKTDFDAYRTDRSGLLFGVQGSTETLTLGAVLSAGTGNVKSDSLVSQDWNDVGGPVYGAYRFGPAALTASALYERHEGKAQGQKRHADVLGASLKVPADAALGGMTVTPYAGWRVIDVDHADAEDRVVVHEKASPPLIVVEAFSYLTPFKTQYLFLPGFFSFFTSRSAFVWVSLVSKVALPLAS